MARREGKGAACPQMKERVHLGRKACGAKAWGVALAYRRLAQAAAGLAAAFLLAAVAGWAGAAAMGGGEAGQTQAAGIASASEAMLSEAVAEGFADEVALPDGAQEVRHNEDACIVGCSVTGEAEEVFEGLKAALIERSWAETPSGVGGCSVFTKTSGAYRWLFVQCVQVGDWTSVVIQYDAPTRGEV